MSYELYRLEKKIDENKDGQETEILLKITKWKGTMEIVKKLTSFVDTDLKDLMDDGA